MKLYLFENAIYKPTQVPFPGFLVVTDDGRNILIDTGMQPVDADVSINGAVQTISRPAKTDCRLLS